MKKVFVETNSIKSQKPKDKPVDGKNTPWDFSCPQYDQRSSCYVNAGTNYGVGIKQPVGHDGDAKMNVSTLPMGCKTKDYDEGY